MVKIFVATSDHKIWELEKFLVSMNYAMSRHDSIEIDLISEGPDAESIGLVDLVVNSATQFDYNLDNLLLTTNNLIQKSLPFSVTRLEPAHFVVNTRKL